MLRALFTFLLACIFAIFIWACVEYKIAYDKLSSIDARARAVLASKPEIYKEYTYIPLTNPKRIAQKLPFYMANRIGVRL
jgi:hypothetical protein